MQEDERKLNMSRRIINETTLRILVPRNYEVGSLIVPRMFAMLHTPEVIASSNSETFTAIAQANSNFNIQGKPLICFTYGPA